jgi:glycosyltransferase involved in cell wall biosynthesis
LENYSGDVAAIGGQPMRAVSSMGLQWLKLLARKTLSHPARQWVRDQRQRIIQKKQDLYERVIIRKQDFRNREGLLNFDFSLFASHQKQGVSALLRVKNEEEKIYHCLASIHDVFDEIVFIDNDSEDRTLEIVCEFKQRHDREDKIKIYSYPFKIARCGPEHFNTPEDSVHSLCYYYNWALSKCLLKYVCKWDGDMILRKEAREPFKRFLQQLKRHKMCWIVFGQAVYRDLASNHFLARGEINGEIRIFPNGFNPRFYKVDLYELLKSEPPLEEGQFDGVLFYELKFVTTDEFSHWSISDIPTERKKRELENFQLVKRNDISSPRFEKLPSSFLDDQIR